MLNTALWKWKHKKRYKTSVCTALAQTSVQDTTKKKKKITGGMTRPLACKTRATLMHKASLLYLPSC